MFLFFELKTIRANVSADLDVRIAVRGLQRFESPSVRSDFKSHDSNRKVKTVQIAVKALPFVHFSDRFQIA